MNSALLPITRLEQYSLRYPQEVLHLVVQNGDDEDEILVFKGFSSSLMNPTATDPDVPLLPATARIIRIDLLASPYDPTVPQYLEQALRTYPKNVRSLRPMIKQAAI
ncbi:MAG: hypothetical protein VKJ02_10975 [Snowella sp.]|nr:hypothetical protein [Snowella sp.]